MGSMRLLTRGGLFAPTLKLRGRSNSVKKCAHRIRPFAIRFISRPPTGAAPAFLWAATDSKGAPGAGGVRFFNRLLTNKREFASVHLIERAN
jgi:hypothetical protein